MEPSPPSPSLIRVNYLYFGALFCLLVLLSGSNILVKDPLQGSRPFFFLYAVGQAAAETALFAFLTYVASTFARGLLFSLWVGTTFLLLISHILDYLLDRILDLSVWQTLAFVFDESLSNFLYLLDASGVPLPVWGAIFSLLFALPWIGCLLYKLSNKVADKHPLLLKKEWLLQSLLCLPAGLLLWDYSASSILHPDAYTSFAQSLPWKFTFLQPESTHLTFSSPLLSPPNEEKIRQAIDASQTRPEKRPNIYLFVVESFREDFITPSTAPHLSRFKEEGNHFHLALSNGNGSHLSWFSLFHSQYPFFWSHLQKKGWQMGSPPLNLLKKWGYQVRLYTSAQLNYYGMEELLFGKQEGLLDHVKTFHHPPPLHAWASDKATLEQLQREIREDPKLQEGQLFILFWDATHFDYSWPKEENSPFKPFANEFAYFRAIQSQKNLDLIKNRYRNAVHFVDHLFGQFLEKLPGKEEAIVVVTGDHGEEFFEHGHLFHGSHLTQEQIHIPLYFKLGEKGPKIDPGRVISQVDLFPTLLDYIGGEAPDYLQGESLLRQAKKGFTLTSRFNAGRTPEQLMLHNGHHKLIANFLYDKEPLQATGLHVVSLRKGDDSPLPDSKEQIKEWTHHEFQGAFETLFPPRAP